MEKNQTTVAVTTSPILKSRTSQKKNPPVLYQKQVGFGPGDRIRYTLSFPAGLTIKESIPSSRDGTTVHWTVILKGVRIHLHRLENSQPQKWLAVSWSGRQDSNLRHLAPKDARERFSNLLRSVWCALFQKIMLSRTFCPTASAGFISQYGQACGHNPAIPERQKPFGDRFLSLKCVDCSEGGQGSQGSLAIKSKLIVSLLFHFLLVDLF